LIEKKKVSCVTKFMDKYPIFSTSLIVIFYIALLCLALFLINNDNNTDTDNILSDSEHEEECVEFKNIEHMEIREYKEPTTLTDEINYRNKYQICLWDSFHRDLDPNGCFYGIKTEPFIYNWNESVCTKYQLVRYE